MSNKEKQEIDNNDSKVIYEGRSENTEISIDGISININSAREEIIKDLRLVASYLNNCDSVLASMDSVLKIEKGKIPKENFHNDGLSLAKINTEILRSENPKYIDSIKKEAELSLDKLSKIPKNSKAEMDEYLKNYNAQL